MAEFQFTSYFENEVLRKRPYLTKEMVSESSNFRFVSNYRKAIDFVFGPVFPNWAADICEWLL
jgi:hypothetical protein